jgi:hypothetical protein
MVLPSPFSAAMTRQRLRRASNQAGGRLVKEQDLRVTDHGERDLEPPLLTRRQGGGALPLGPPQRHEVEHPVDAQSLRIVAGKGAHGLLYGKLRLQGGFLKHDADAPTQPRRAEAGIEAGDQDVAGIALVVAFKNPERCGLAGTGRTDQGKGLAALDLEGDAVKDDARAV